MVIKAMAQHSVVRKYKKIGYFVVNALTILRFVLAYLFVEQIQRGGDVFRLMLLFWLVVISDFVDGRLARRWGVESKLGSAMDVSADLFFVLSSAIALYYRTLIPLWLIVILLFKTTEFFITSAVLRRLRMQRSDEELERCRFHKRSGVAGLRKSLFVYDVLGRVVAAVFYVIPMVVVLLSKMMDERILDAALLAFFVPTGIAAVVSSMHRISLCLTEKEEDVDSFS